MLIYERNEIYHSKIKHIGCGALKQYLKSPANYKYYIESPKKEPTEAMIFGSAYHIAMLEPELIEQEIFIINPDERPDKTKTFAAKENKEWKEAILLANSKKLIIDMENWQTILKMKEIAFSNPLVKFLLSDGKPEMSCYHNLDGVNVKVKPDYLKDNAIIDLKTIAGGSDKDNFIRACANNYYDIQSAFYSDVLQDHDKKERQFIFIAQQKEEPYFIGVYRASENMLSTGRYAYTQLLEMHKYCIENNHYPGNEIYSDNEFGITDIDMPSWRQKELNYNYKKI